MQYIPCNMNSFFVLGVGHIIVPGAPFTNFDRSMDK